MRAHDKDQRLVARETRLQLNFGMDAFCSWLKRGTGDDLIRGARRGKTNTGKSLESEQMLRPF